MIFLLNSGHKLWILEASPYVETNPSPSPLIFRFHEYHRFHGHFKISSQHMGKTYGTNVPIHLRILKNQVNSHRFQGSKRMQMLRQALDVATILSTHWTPLGGLRPGSRHLPGQSGKVSGYSRDFSNQNSWKIWGWSIPWLVLIICRIYDL